MKYLHCSNGDEGEKGEQREAANTAALTTLDYKNSKLQKEKNDARLYMQRAHRSKTNDKNE